MLSLPQVLHEAQRHAVVEIAIEPGEPVTFHGEQGVLVLGEALDESEVSDALTQVLAPEQQAELAVASMVEFHVQGFAEWSFVAETSSEGVIIRGRIRDGVIPDEYGAPLDLPPLEPFEHERSTEIPRSSSALRTTEPRETRWDVEAVGADEPAVVEAVERTPTGAIEDPTLAATMASTRQSDEVGSPDTSFDEIEGLIDFALVGRAPMTTDLPEMRAENDATPPPRTPPQGRGTRPTMRGDDTLAMHVDALVPSTIVHLAAGGVGQRLLEHFEGGFEIVDRETWQTITTRPLTEIPLAQAYLVRLEDPSVCLPWLLRRLEEGSCLVVETRARTAAGARRTLLGAGSSLHVARWIDAHKHLWLHADGNAWVLEAM